MSTENTSSGGGRVNHKELLPKVKAIKTQMNDRRKSFTFDQLANFYNITPAATMRGGSPRF